jgi:Holliday junction resolvasome RuvABC endonuclease subunit
MICLAFDTATKTGVCVGSAGSRPRAWSVNLGLARRPDNSIDWAPRFAKTLRMVSYYISEFRPDVVAVEAFVGGPKANTDLAGLVACVLGEAQRLGVKPVSYYPATIRKHFLGGVSRSNKTPIKSQVYAKCQILGWNVPDTDAADAAALWDYTCSLQSRAHQISSVGGLFKP